MEGELLPKYVAELRRAHPSQVQACILGYATIAPAQKLRAIRAHAGHPNDWPAEYADADLLKGIAREIEFGRYLQAECAARHIPYFDTSDDFPAALDEVIAFVQERS